MNEYISEYKNYLTDVKKSSNNTTVSYIRDVSRFCDYLSSNKFDVLNTNEKIINDYLAALLNEGKSQATKTRVTASIKNFYKFLCRNNYISFNPTVSIKSPRTPNSLPSVLESKEIIELLSKPDTATLKGKRDKAILEIMYATGIRVSELINLTLNDINLQIGILSIASEQGEPRIVPIYPEAIEHTKDYISNVREVITYNNQDNKLFLNMNGYSMTRQGCWKIIKQYARLIGLEDKLTPQTLRHSFAAHLLENGAQLNDIKVMLGHSDISSTQKYAQLIKSKYMQSYSKYHPLAKTK